MSPPVFPFSVLVSKQFQFIQVELWINKYYYIHCILLIIFMIRDLRNMQCIYSTRIQFPPPSMCVCVCVRIFVCCMCVYLCQYLHRAPPLTMLRRTSHAISNCMRTDTPDHLTPALHWTTVVEVHSAKDTNHCIRLQAYMCPIFISNVLLDICLKMQNSLLCKLH